MSSLSAPKILHTLRCSPCHGHEALHKFDDLLRTGLGNIANLSISDIQWVQASLSVSFGRLGVRRVASLALPAFLESAASIHTLQSLLLHNSHHSPDLHRDNVLITWLTTFSSTAPAAPSDGNQSAWDKPDIAADLAAVKSYLFDSLDSWPSQRITAVAGYTRFHYRHASSNSTTKQSVIIIIIIIIIITDIYIACRMKY